MNNNGPVCEKCFEKKLPFHVNPFTLQLTEQKQEPFSKNLKKAKTRFLIGF